MVQSTMKLQALNTGDSLSSLAELTLSGWDSSSPINTSLPHKHREMPIRYPTHTPSCCDALSTGTGHAHATTTHPRHGTLRVGGDSTPVRSCPDPPLFNATYRSHTAAPLRPHEPTASYSIPPLTCLVVERVAIFSLLSGTTHSISLGPATRHRLATSTLYVLEVESV